MRKVLAQTSWDTTVEAMEALLDQTESQTAKYSGEKQPGSTVATATPLPTPPLKNTARTILPERDARPLDKDSARL